MPLSDLDVSWFWRFLKGSQTIGTWFIDNPTAAVAWLALLIATSAFIHQVLQGQQLPNASKVQEWMAYNEFRQYCQSQFDKGILWDDCNKTLALPMKAPPLTNTETFLQNEKLFSRSQTLAERTAASMQVDPEHGRK